MRNYWSKIHEKIGIQEDQSCQIKYRTSRYIWISDNQQFFIYLFFLVYVPVKFEFQINNKLFFSISVPMPYLWNSHTKKRLFIQNSNLTGRPAFLFIKIGNPSGEVSSAVGAALVQGHLPVWVIREVELCFQKLIRIKGTKLECRAYQGWRLW